jgi:uncharacterized protein
MKESDSHWLRLPEPRLAPPPAPRSSYLVMRDGVRLAIDLYLPERTSSRVPTILRQTRYMRSREPRRFASGVASQFDLYARTRRVFLEAGYAWVDVDVRGTGASSGAWICPWSPDEVADGAEVVDFIVREPWSNGRVGSLGISYDGTCADMLATKMHPAVRAVAPMFALYDVFTDVAFPGGIHLSGFTERWATYNAALDRGEFHEGMCVALALMGVAALASPRPRADERLYAWLARGGELAGRRRAARLLSRLVAGVRAPGGGVAPRVDRTANMNVHVIGSRVVFRDDRGMLSALPEADIDVMSPHAFRAQATSGGAAVYSYSGWRDGAYQHAAIKRYLSVRAPGSRLTLGPWVHTGKLQVPAFDVARPSHFDHDAELLGFFDEHVQDRPSRGDGQPVHYYTMVEGRWKAASTWPPPGTRVEPLYLAKGRVLARETPQESAVHTLVEEGTSGTGVRSRWRSLLSLVPGDYPDRRERDARLLHCETAPLASDTEVTGHPVVRLFLSSSHDDAHVFAYLEDVAPDGRVAYVTEGQLRLLHRRLAARSTVTTPVSSGDTPDPPAPARSFTRADASPLPPGEVAEVVFDLLPISWLFLRGHRVRLALAGADRDHFDVMAPRTLEVHASPERASRLELPVVRAS